MYQQSYRKCRNVYGICKIFEIVTKRRSNEECQDDQININKLCKKYDFIQVVNLISFLKIVTFIQIPMNLPMKYFTTSG